MSQSLFVLGEALMDCVAQGDGKLLPLMGGSPYNMARAAALRGAAVSYLNPLSTDLFGQQLGAQLRADGVALSGGSSRRPTSLAVVQIDNGQPSYGFYREGIADRDTDAEQLLQVLRAVPAGILHTGSLLLVPPEHDKTLRVLEGARALGWTISVDVNLRPKLADDLAAYVAAVRSVLPLTDWLKASDEDLETLGFGSARRERAPELVQTLRAVAGPGRLAHVALTFGEHGAHLDIAGRASGADVPSVAVSDTVGAGDTFWGNCVADWAMATGAAERCANTLQQAMAAAAINCTRSGCQPPTWAETQAFLTR